MNNRERADNFWSDYLKEASKPKKPKGYFTTIANSMRIGDSKLMAKDEAQQLYWSIRRRGSYLSKTKRDKPSGKIRVWKLPNPANPI